MSPRPDPEPYDVIVVTNEMPLNRLGGVGSVMENLVSGFEKNRVRCLFFLIRHGYSPEDIRALSEIYPHLHVGPIRDLAHFHAPVIHIHAYNYDDELPAYIGNAKTIYTVHSLLILEAHSNDVDMTHAIRKQEAMIRSCDWVVLVSQSEHEAYRRFGYEALNPRVRVIHNGLRDPGLSLKSRTEAGIIGFCGRLVPRKRPEYVQLILKEKDFSDHKVMIAGRGFSPFAGDLVRSLGLSRRVRYLGWCGGPRLQAFYDTIDVLAVTSAYEPFGMVALEAAARGIPVICNRTGGLPEILGDHAFFYEKDSYDAFKDAALTWRFSTPTKRDRMCRKARRRYESLFTDIRMAGQYLALYREIS